MEQRRDLRLVSLELVERLADGGLFIRNVFEFQHRQRDAVDEHHHIGAPVEMAFLHRELVDGEKFVGFGIRKINQPDLVVNDFARLVAKLHIHAFHQQPMKRAVVFDERGMADEPEFPQRFLQTFQRNLGIQILQLGLQPVEKKNLLVIRALRRRFARRNRQPGQNFVTQACEASRARLLLRRIP